MSDPMQRIKQDHKDSPSRTEFWGTITLGVLVLLVSAYIFFIVSRQEKTNFIYFAMALLFFAVAASMTSIVLVFRGQQKLGLETSFYTMLALGVASVSLFQGRVLQASLSILTISVIAIGWLIPSASRRRFSITAAAAIVLMWAVEWMNPSWRLPLPAAPAGPIAAVVFGVLFFVLMLPRFRDFSLRSKLLSSILLITGLSVLIFGYFAYTRTQQSQAFLTNQLRTTVSQQSQQQLSNTAQTEAGIADQTLSAVADDVKNLAVSQTLFYNQQSVLGQGAYWDAHTKVTKMSGGQYGNSPNDPASIFIPNTVTLTEPMISDLNTTAYLDFSAPGVMRANPDVAAVYFDSSTGFSTYYPNIDLAANIPPDFDLLGQSFYTVATPANDPQHTIVWTQPYQDPAGSGLIVTCSIPVYDQNNQFKGVMSADVQLSKLSAQIAAIKLGQTGFAFLVDSSGHMIAMPDAGYKFFNLQAENVPVGETPKETVLGQGSTELQGVTRQMTSGQQGLATLTSQNQQYYVAYAPIPSVGYSIGMIVPTAELDAAFYKASGQIANETQSTLNLALIILIVILLAAAGVSFLLSQYISRPLVDLTRSAEKISAGDLSVQTHITSKDETGVLARTFNAMTAQLRNFISTLEQRVADRTKALSNVAEISTVAASIRNEHEMLAMFVHLTQRRFGLYHAHVFVYDEATEQLKIIACGWKEGDEHEGTHGTTAIPVAQEQSLVARAARTKKGVIVNDVHADPNWLPNPLLPDTASELAVPLLVGDKVIGVLDVQSDRLNAFTEADIDVQTTLGSQVAVAIQNLRQYESTQKIANDLSVVANVGIATSNITEINRLLQEVVDISKKSFELYHAHIYLLNDAGDSLRLAAGAGEVGRQMVNEEHQIPLDSQKSLVARAARLHQGVVVNDVTADPDFLPNPLLPETRSEMAVPMIVGGKVVGVLDVQSERVNRFTEVDVNIKTTLAAQVAVALQNARSFAQAQRQADRESALNSITQKIQSATTIEMALQIAARELGHALGMKPTLVALGASAQLGDQKSKQ